MIMDAGMNWNDLGAKVLGGTPLSRDEGILILRSSDDELLAVLQAAFDVRRRFFGRRVNLHVIQNAKSGLCSEDCVFCSQSAISSSPIPRYTMQSPYEMVEGAKRADELGAVKYCIVASSRGPSPEELATVCDTLRQIKSHSKIHLCVSLGLLTEDETRQLKAAGADRINHNLETSRRYFPKICQAHGYDNRIATIRNAKAAGLEICSGGIVGMGEAFEDRVDLALELRDLKVNSIPVNFFNPRAGTPLEKIPKMKPGDCLRALAMFRMANPACDIRAAGGREACIGHLQPFVLYAANSIFTEGYLTTPGQGYLSDRAMIEEAGFEVAAIEA
jgi:biotin synthase